MTEPPTVYLLKDRQFISIDKVWTFVPAQQIGGQFIATFKEFPPSQKSGSFGMDQVLERLQTTPKSGN